MRLSSHIRFNRTHLAADSTNPFFAQPISTSASVCLPANPTDHQGEWPILESDSDFNTVLNESDVGTTKCLIDFGFGRNVDSTLSFRKPDFSMLERYATYVNTGFVSSVISRDNVVRMNVELLYILMKANAPLNLFSKVKEWAHNSCINGINFGDKACLRDRREAYLNKLESQLNMDMGKANQIRLTLRGTNQIVPITVHDFERQVYSLLTDPFVMSDDNLIFPATAVDENGPFGSPKQWKDISGCDQLNDVVDGQAYFQAWHAHVEMPGLHVLCCPIFFIDKTHVDVQGRLCLEPVSFTLSIFTKEARRNPTFWRQLGLIPNQSNMENASPIDRATDYHHIIETIFQSLVKVQQGPGLAWRLTYHQIMYDVVWKFPVLFIIGDTEGHDKMCGKYLSRTSKVNRLCRYCDCPTQHTDDPYVKFNFTSSQEIIQLVRNEDSVGLKNISYHGLLNGFRYVVFCDEKRGINGSTPAELLHVWEKGLFLQLMSALMGLKRAKKTATKRKLLLNGEYDYDSNMDKKMAAKPSHKRKVVVVDLR